MIELIEESQTIRPESSLKERLIADILLLGVQGHYRTERCVFVDFHGHVNHISICIRENEVDYQNKLAETSIQLKPFTFCLPEEKEAFEQDVIQKLKQTKRYLENFIENKDIDPEDELPIPSLDF